MSTYKQYLISLTTGTLLAMSSIGFISYNIDPANIYHDSIEPNNSPSAYITILKKSKFGLIESTHLERDLQLSHARQGGGECAILGSSHIMQISSFRKISSLKNLCSTLVNLGASGGTLEDYIALSYELINSNQKPSIIVFGIDPWSLDFKRDSRWSRYKESYENMMIYLNKSNVRLFFDDIYTKWKLFTNLFNLEYFMLSINEFEFNKFIFSKISINNDSFKAAPLFELSEGLDKPVILPDGSYVYSREFVQLNTPPTVPYGGSGYKINIGSQFSEDAIKLFSNLNKRLNMDGISTVFLMTPYHNKLWKNENSNNTQALIEVEKRIRTLGKVLGVKVLGSYDPRKIGCNPDEFYDDGHPTVACLSKIKN